MYWIRVNLAIGVLEIILTLYIHRIHLSIFSPAVVPLPLLLQVSLYFCDFMDFF